MADLTPAQTKLVMLIERIFADGEVEPAERAELRQFWVKQGLSVRQVRVVVDGLHLPEEAMPPEMWRVVSGPPPSAPVAPAAPTMRGT